MDPGAMDPTWQEGLLPSLSSSVGGFRGALLRLRRATQGNGAARSEMARNVEKLDSMRAMLSYLHASTTSSAWVHPALAEDFSRGLGLIDELQQMQHEDPVPEEYEEDVDMGYNLSSYGRAASYASPNHSRWGRTGGNGRNNNEVTEALLDAQHSLALLTVHHSNACMRQLRQQEARLAQAEQSESALQDMASDFAQLRAEYTKARAELKALEEQLTIYKEALLATEARVTLESQGTQTPEALSPEVSSGAVSLRDIVDAQVNNLKAAFEEAADEDVGGSIAGSAPASRPGSAYASVACSPAAKANQPSEATSELVSPAQPEAAVQQEQGAHEQQALPRAQPGVQASQTAAPVLPARLRSINRSRQVSAGGGQPTLVPLYNPRPGPYSDCPNRNVSPTQVQLMEAAKRSAVDRLQAAGVVKAQPREARPLRAAPPKAPTSSGSATAPASLNGSPAAASAGTRSRGQSPVATPAKRFCSVAASPTGLVRTSSGNGAEVAACPGPASTSPAAPSPEPVPGAAAESSSALLTRRASSSSTTSTSSASGDWQLNLQRMLHQQQQAASQAAKSNRATSPTRSSPRASPPGSPPSDRATSCVFAAGSPPRSPSRGLLELLQPEGEGLAGLGLTASPTRRSLGESLADASRQEDTRRGLLRSSAASSALGFSTGAKGAAAATREPAPASSAPSTATRDVATETDPLPWLNAYYSSAGAGGVPPSPRTQRMLTRAGEYASNQLAAASLVGPQIMGASGAPAAGQPLQDPYWLQVMELVATIDSSAAQLIENTFTLWRASLGLPFAIAGLLLWGRSKSQGPMANQPAASMQASPRRRLPLSPRKRAGAMQQQGVAAGLRQGQPAPLDQQLGAVPPCPYPIL